MPTSDDDETALSRTVASTATLKIAGLYSLDPFYTPLEERFERITRLARRALDVPIAAITVVTDGRQWFKSISGLQLTELPVSESLCAEVIRDGRQMIVCDTLDDLYMMSNPLVCEKPKVRFYAGFPISDSEGRTVGTFCAMALEPRKPDDAFRTTLADLGDMAQRELFTVELHNAQAALVSKLGKARRQAMFDPLTRLWNRKGATDLLHAALRDAARHRHSIGICLADVDNFKQINDRFGHQTGDQVLRRVATAIVASVRPQDIVCRYGGEEFLVILHDLDEQGCSAVAERICAGIRDLAIRTRRGAFRATISIGVALNEGGGIVATEELIGLADTALYVSKNEGRDRVSIARAGR